MADDLPPLASVPPQEPGDIPAPGRRGRGRPPALNADGTRKNPAKGTRSRARTDRAPKRETTPPRTPSKASRKTRIQSALTDFSAVLYLVPRLREDALSAREVELLADSLDKQCRERPRLAKVIDNILTASQTGGIIGIIAIIAARRVARHKLAGIPEFADPILGRIIRDDGTPANPMLAAATDPAILAALNEQMAGAMPNITPTEQPSASVDDLPPVGAPALPVEDALFDFEHSDFAAVG